MAIRKHTNNYASTLNGAITNVATTLIVTSATGLPSIGAGETYNLTLDDGAGVIEIVTVTDDASSPTLTVTRGAEGTTGVAWDDLSVIELRPTADGFDRKADGATSSTDGNIVLFDGTSGKVLKESSSTLQAVRDLAPTAGTTGTGAEVRATAPTVSTLTSSADILVNGMVVGRGNGNTSTNVAFGPSALGTTAGTSAHNVAIGSSVLESIVNADYNVGIGSDALKRSVGAVYNVGIGYAAGSYITTGNGNIALGGSALLLTTTGGNNISIGYSSLFYNITGDDNIALGQYALLGTNGTSISGNVGIGKASLYSITTSGNYNVAIGFYSGTISGTGSASVTSGGFNTLIGTNAGVDAGAATGTIAIGANAFADMATGGTSSDDGPGLAIGSVGYPVAMRGDASAYAAVGSSLGYMRVKLNGTYVKIQIYADS